jgi:tetratricopeptide (TPR) repeat protein
MLDSRKCNSSDFYMELATKIHTWQPSAESAVSIGTFWYNQKEYKKAAAFYEEGLALSKDETEKAKLYEKLAQIDLSRGSYKSAVSYARKMDNKCKANGIIARAIASSAPSCGSSSIEVSFAYCLAIDYANKAKGCVSSSTVSAWKNRLAGKSDLFLNEYKVGQTVTVKCWGESTTIRAID